ncbi:MAG: hypothetical protein FWE91_09415 [Defluviitaleaceae bacterium]|nr:hypothetical protein [Defluviitaleaceae bacterium]
MRITLLTILALSLVTVCITILSVYNARQNFLIPIIGHIERTGFYNIDEMERGNLEQETEELIHIQLGIDQDGMVRMQLIIDRSQNDFQIYSLVIAALFVIIGTVFAYIISG